MLDTIQKKETITQTELLKSSFRLLSTEAIVFLMITSAYSGIVLSFWSGIFPSCIGFTRRLHENTRMIVAFNAIFTGVGQATGGFLFGILSSKTRLLGRGPVVVAGTCIHLLVFFGVYVNFPAVAPLSPNDEVGMIEPQVWITLACGFFLGFGDALLNTQIFSLIISEYPKQTAQVFSLNKFFQHLLTCAAFVYGARLRLDAQLLMLGVGGTVGCVAFLLCERSIRRRKTSAQVDKKDLNGVTERF
ncbi:UNC93-like protein MFSD11 [Aphelenchoides fujianensis]|nr:UNC93-like protein MFSD11 [Aphelenchoides fujianensis]